LDMGQPFFRRDAWPISSSVPMVYGAPSMRTRTALVGVLWLIASCAVVPTVVGDGTGSGISSAAGSYLLTPVGTNNYTLHAYLADLGMPIYRGDTLFYYLQANSGSGPHVFFEFMSHHISCRYYMHYKSSVA